MYNLTLDMIHPGLIASSSVWTSTLVEMIIPTHVSHFRENVILVVFRLENANLVIRWSILVFMVTPYLIEVTVFPLTRHGITKGYNVPVRLLQEPKKNL
jgi:hypothetical protein